MDMRHVVKHLRAFVLMICLMLVMGTAAHAALQGFATTPALMPPGSGSPGVPIGGIPAWFQDINGVSVQPCLIPATCGLIGIVDPLFNPALPMSYPGNFPVEAFYSDVVSIFPVGPASATVVMAMEFTFIDSVTGALIGAPPRPANALGVPFQRHRLVISYPPGVPAPTVGNFTITHPWGVTTFTGPKCVNNAGGLKCSMTRDLPLPGAIPPSFAAALGTGIAGSQSTFLRDPLAPAGFLGGGLATAAFTGAVAGSANSVSVTDPLGNTGTTTSLTLLVGQLLGLTAAPATITFPASKPTITSASIPVTITNPSAAGSAQIGAFAVTGANALDFVVTPGTCTTNAILGPNGTCNFSVTFFEGAPGVNGTKSALVSFPVITPLSFPPVTVNLAGAIDNISPSVVTTLPTDGATSPANNRPHVTFSEPVIGVSSTTFTIKDAAGVDVGGTPTLDATGTLADYTLPLSNLTPGKTYTATLTTGITDLVGNPLVLKTFSFTASAPDNAAPKVSSTDPVNNSTGAKVADPITATFTGSVDPNTLNATTFSLSDGVTGTVTFDPTTGVAIFKPNTALQYFHKYIATIKGGASGVTSLGQVPLALDFTWSFLTNGAPSAPSLFLPDDLATNVAVPVQFQWVKAKDADGEPVTYHLWYCTNPSMFGCTPVDIATASASSSLHDTLAGLGGYGAGILLAGFAIVGGVRSRRKIFFFIAVLAISVMAATACGNKTETVSVPSTPDPATLMLKSVSGLKSGTTYYWKVVADDGNGGLIDSETRSFTTL